MWSFASATVSASTMGEDGGGAHSHHQQSTLGGGGGGGGAHLHCPLFYLG